MKKTLSARIKCEKEYANSLHQLLAISVKLDPPYYDSSVYRVRCYLVGLLFEPDMSFLQRVTIFK